MSKQLYEDRAAVWSSMEELISAGADTWTAEQTQEYARKEDEYRTLTEKINMVERHSSLARPAGPKIDAGRVAAGVETEDRTTAYMGAFDRFLRRGYERLSAEDRTLLDGRLQEVGSEDRTMSTTTGSEGGYLVPEAVRPKLIEALKAFGGLRGMAEVITTGTGNKINLPGNDDTGNVGEIVNENTDVNDQDLAFTNVSVDAFIFSSKAVRIPISLLEDSVLDLAAYVTRKQGERIGRKQADLWINGVGTTEPLGILPGRDTAKDVNTTAAFTYANLVDLTRKVDPAYRALPGTGFLMSDSSTGALLKMVDGQQRPLWEPAIVQGQPDRLLGWPVAVDQAMGADAAGQQPIAFGNWNESYLIRDVNAVTVLRLAELYARFHQVGFIGFVRSDGTVKNKAAYAVIDRTA